jgi:hypothetical protein
MAGHPESILIENGSCSGNPNKNKNPQDVDLTDYFFPPSTLPPSFSLLSFYLCLLSSGFK